MLTNRIDITHRAPRACVRTTSALVVMAPSSSARCSWSPTPASGGAPNPSNSARRPASLRSTVVPLSSMEPYSTSTGIVTRPRTALRRWLSSAGPVTRMRQRMTAPWSTSVTSAGYERWLSWPFQ